MIYFMQSVDGGPIKIGYSCDVERRLHELEKAYGIPLALLFTMDGDEELEAEIHARFANLRLGVTEQFRPTLDLMAFIGRPLLVGANADAIEAMPSKGSNRNGESDRSDVTTKIDKTILGRAKLVANHRGIPVAELLSELVEGPLDKEYLKMVRDLEANAK